MTQLSSGLISETLLLLHAVQHYNCTILKQAVTLHMAYGVNAQAAITCAQQNGWLVIDSGNITLTDCGRKLTERFDSTSLDTDLWKSILREYIFLHAPIWASRIPYGRKEAFIIMSQDEKRCFIEAGLMDSPASRETVRWWDAVSERIRSEHHLTLDETGRTGEVLTMQYETLRTNAEPVWQAFETNLTGYDIISCVSSTMSDQLLIEVKASRREIKHAFMILSRHEWDVATRRPVGSQYQFYLWLLGHIQKLAIISVSEMAQHVPEDQGGGRWKEIEIPFSLFADRFVDVV